MMCQPFPDICHGSLVVFISYKTMRINAIPISYLVAKSVGLGPTVEPPLPVARWHPDTSVSSPIGLPVLYHDREQAASM